MSGNKFTILGLEKILASLEETANKLHYSSLREYPKHIYRSYDSSCVELRQAHAFLSNLTDIKYIELGINDIDKQLNYMDARCKDLEDFYYRAEENDLSDISLGIADIQRMSLDLRKKRTQLLSTEFEVDLNDSTKQALKLI